MPFLFALLFIISFAERFDDAAAAVSAYDAIIFAADISRRRDAKDAPMMFFDADAERLRCLFSAADAMLMLRRLRHYYDY